MLLSASLVPVGAGCSLFSGGEGPSGDEDPGRIEALVVEPALIEEGERAEVSWRTANLSDCVLEPGGVEVDSNGSYTLEPAETVDVALTCKTVLDEAVSATTTLTVVPRPGLTAFEVSPEAFLPGDPVTLTWASEHTSGCQLSAGEGDPGETLAASGSLALTPAQSTTWTLRCQGERSETEPATVSATLVDRIVVDHFTATPEALLQGERAQLSWSVTGASACSIEPGVGEVELVGTAEVEPPLGTNTFTLSCDNALDEASRTVEVRVALPTVSIVFFTAEPATVEAGGEVTLSWQAVDAADCTLEPGEGEVPAAGELTVVPPQNTTYALTCRGQGEDDVAEQTASVAVVDVPVITDLTASRVDVEPGDTVVLQFSSENTTGCVVDAPGGESLAPVDVLVVTPEQTTTYNLVCSGPVSSVSSSIEIEVHPPVTINTFRVERGAIEAGESTSVLWSSSGATAGCTIEPGSITGGASGFQAVSPDVTTTYTLLCSSEAGSETAEATLVVHPRLVIDSFAPAKYVIELGGSTELAWAATGASEGCSLDQGIGAVATEGVRTVTPLVDTLYTLTCSSPVAETSTSVQVDVVDRLVVGPLSASALVVEEGQSATLSWSASGATGCSINEGVGDVVTEGSVEVTPPVTTTYTLTCVNDAATRTARVTVEVVLPVEVRSFASVPQTIEQEATATLGWDVQGATSCSLESAPPDPGVGAVSTLGPASVSPAVTTVYTLRCQGPAGEDSDSATVTVLAPSRIVSFRTTDGDGSDIDVLEEGGQSFLTWSSEDTTYCLLAADPLYEPPPGYDELGQVDHPAGDLWVQPAETTTFTLECGNPAGKRVETRQILVVEPARIVSFTAVTPIVQRQTSVLSFTAKATDVCSIDNGVGPVPTSPENTPEGPVAVGTVEVAPTATTTYTLTCAGPAGLEKTESVEVEVRPATGPARIESFEAGSASLTVGESTPLSWRLSGALETHLTLTPEPGSVSGEVATEVVPFGTPGQWPEPAFYRLTYFNTETSRRYVEPEALPPGAEIPPEGMYTSHTSGAGEVSVEDVAVLPSGRVALAGTLRGGTKTFQASPEEVRLTASRGSEAYVVTLTGDGSVAWAAGSDGDDFAYGTGVSIGADGSAALAGSFYSSVTLFSAVTLDPAETVGSSVALANGSLAETDAMVARYDSRGLLLWARQGAGSGFAEAEDVALLDDGSVVAVGSFSDAVTWDDGVGGTVTLTADDGDGRDVFVVRYDAGGVLVASAHFGGPGNDSAYAVTAQGPELWIAGAFRESFSIPTPGSAAGDTTTLVSAGLSDGWVARLSGNGTARWAVRLGGIHSDELEAIAAGPGETVAVGGSVLGPVGSNPEYDFGLLDLTLNGQRDGVLVELGADGSLVWGRSLGGSADDRVRGVAHQPDGVLVATGTFAGLAALAPFAGSNFSIPSRGPTDVFVAGYAPQNGALLYASQIGGVNDEDVGGIGLLHDGTMVVGVMFEGGAQVGSDVYTGGSPETRPLVVGGPLALPLPGSTLVGASDVTWAKLATPNEKYVSVAYRGVDFTSDVVPLFTSWDCVSCHNSQAPLDLTGSPEAIFDVLREEGLPVEQRSLALPFDSANSLLLSKPQADSHGGGVLVAPGSLFDLLVTQWLDEGALFEGDPDL